MIVFLLIVCLVCLAGWIVSHFGLGKPKSDYKSHTQSPDDWK